MSEGWLRSDPDWTTDHIIRQRTDDYRRETEPSKRTRELRSPQEPPGAQAGDVHEPGVISATECSSEPLMAPQAKLLYSGADAFRLHSTYGYPIELIQEEARKRGLEVDMAEYEILMQEHRAISRRDKFKQPPRRQEE